MWSIRQLLWVVGAGLLLAGSALGQTFQYSRGWTNGKRSEGGRGGYLLSSPGQPQQADGAPGGPCGIQRLRALLEGKPPSTDSAYVLCELSRLPEDEFRLRKALSSGGVRGPLLPAPQVGTGPGDELAE